MEALLVIDMLNDFVSPDGRLFVPGADEIVQPIANVIGRAQNAGMRLIFAHDSHPEDSEEFKTFPPHCIRRTEGSFPVDGIMKMANQNSGFAATIILKDDLSLFTAKGAPVEFFGLDAVYVCGVATDYCVLQAVAGARDRNGVAITNLTRLVDNVYVLEDLIRGVNMKPGDEERAIEVMKSAGAKFITSNQFPRPKRNHQPRDRSER